MSSYSQEVSSILDNRERVRISKQIRTLLKKISQNNLKSLNCLDVGCSSGIITNELAKEFGSIVGIDVDEPAIAAAKSSFKRKNLKFKMMSTEKISYKDNSFDVVICNQTYQFVNNPKRMMNEIHRVLKTKGICIMSARNKFALFEAQTNILLIHLLPKALRNLILSIIKQTYYEAHYLNYSQLKKLFKKFEIINMTSLIIKTPNEYGFTSLNKYSYISRFIPLYIINSLMPLIPNYILILKKC